MAASNSLNMDTSGVQTYNATTGGLDGSATTQYAVQCGDANNKIQSVASLGTSGQVLTSNGAGALPAWSTATYPATAGTSGKVLISDGTNIVSSTPTFPNASATSGKIIKSDGTNWVASTETYAAPGTSGNILTSDGTNWTSAAAGSGNLLIATKTLTSAQVKALRATPIEIIAAPGSGKGIVIVSATCKLNYGGTNVFTAGASQTIALYYNNNTTIVNGSLGNLCPNAMIVSSANKFSINNSAFTSNNNSAGVLDNVNVAIWNTVATEITGNAANDNTISFTAAYYIITF